MIRLEVPATEMLPESGPGASDCGLKPLDEVMRRMSTQIGISSRRLQFGQVTGMRRRPRTQLEKTQSDSEPLPESSTSFATPCGT